MTTLVGGVYSVTSAFPRKSTPAILNRQSNFWLTSSFSGNIFSFSFRFGIKAGPLCGDAMYSKTSLIGLLIVIDDDTLVILCIVKNYSRFLSTFYFIQYSILNKIILYEFFKNHRC